MENSEEKKAEKTIGEMNKRRETMPDGKRYIIYYTFGEEKLGEGFASAWYEIEVKKNV